MKTILLIENDLLLLKTMEAILSAKGYRVSLSKDGKEALQQVHDNQFDLVITDLMLPYASGMEIIEKVKEQQPQTPVIIVSSSHSEESIIEGFHIGADDYITKPFTPSELLSRINRLINR